MRIRYIRTRPTGWSLRLQTSILLVCFIPTDGKNQHGLTRAYQKNLPKSNSSTCPRQLPPKHRVRSPSTRISTATGLSVWTCLVRPAGHLCRRSRASALVSRVCWRRIRATNGRPGTRILSCRIAAGQGTFISSMMMTMSDSIIVIRFWAFFWFLSGWVGYAFAGATLFLFSSSFYLFVNFDPILTILDKLISSYYIFLLIHCLTSLLPSAICIVPLCYLIQTYQSRI